jgi:hypothetical protein
LYKSDYFPDTKLDPEIWNPREDIFEDHFLVFENGEIHPLSPKAEFTIQRLRLNRKPLLLFRKQKANWIKNKKILLRYKELLDLSQSMNKQLLKMIGEQTKLLEEQQQLLNLLIRQNNDK